MEMLVRSVHRHRILCSLVEVSLALSLKEHSISVLYLSGILLLQLKFKTHDNISITGVFRVLSGGGMHLSGA